MDSNDAGGVDSDDARGAKVKKCIPGATLSLLQDLLERRKVVGRSLSFTRTDAEVNFTAYLEARFWFGLAISASRAETN